MYRFVDMFYWGKKKTQRCAKGLIDWIVFYAVSATFQPYNDGVQNVRLG